MHNNSLKGEKNHHLSQLPFFGGGGGGVGEGKGVISIQDHMANM